MRAHVGIDPGHTGGAAVLDEDGRCILAMHWRPRRSTWSLCFWRAGQGGEDTLPPRASAVGAALLEQLLALGVTSITLTGEDVYLGEDFTAAVKIARAGAAITAPLMEHFEVRDRLVHAQTWRTAIQGLNNHRRPVLKSRALDLIPAEVPGLAEALATLGDVDHPAEACGIARWRLLQENPRQGSLLTPRRAS